MKKNGHKTTMMRLSSLFFSDDELDLPHIGTQTCRVYERACKRAREVDGQWVYNYQIKQLVL